MTAADTVLEASLLAECVLALFLAAGFSGPLRKRNPANGYCGGFFLAYAAVISDRIYVSTGSYLIAPHLTEVLTAVELLFPPLLYLVVDCSVRGQRGTLRRIAPHALPFVLGLLLRIPIFLLSGTDKATWEGSELVSHEALPLWHVDLVDAADDAIDLLYLVTVTLYLWLSVHRLRVHTGQLRDIHSDTEGKTLLWLGWLVGLYGLLWFCVVFNEDISSLGPGFQMAVALGELLALFALALCAISQEPVYSSSEALELARLVPPAGRKYSKSALSTDDIERIGQKLEQHMRDDAPYLDPGLSLPQLARALSVNTNYLSQTINSRYNKRFHDFVNGYRVAAACEALEQNTDTAVIDIAMSCGFNSKSTFNSVFKKLTDRTPTQYRREYSRG